MIKIFLALFILTFALFMNQASAQDTYQGDQVVTSAPAEPIANVRKTGDVGLGLTVGTPVAFNMKFWNSEATAVNMNLAYQSGDLAIMADHLWHFRKWAASDDQPAIFSPYLGVGLMAILSTTGTSKSERPLYKRTDNEDGVGVGARIPLGLEFLPADQRFGFFGEIAPGAIFTPTEFSFLQAGVGGRYYF
jgi:hypothetical protein